MEEKVSSHLFSLQEDSFYMRMLFILFFTFARIGLFTFGGGYAMISVIEHLCVEKQKWFTHEELLEMTVIAESTPGPIAINCATFTGHKIAGIPGAIAATLGMVTPSFLIIYGISMFLGNFLELTLVANAFRGIKIAVGLLILDAGLNMAKKAKKTPLTRAIILSACTAMLVIHIMAWKISSISLMLIAAMVSLLIFIIGDRKKGGADK